MKKSLSSILLTVLASCILVSCTASHVLLREDLALANDVPLDDGDYEFVQFWHREFKSGDDIVKQLRFRRSGDDAELTVKRTSIIREKAPVWLIYSDDDIKKADENIISDAVKFYEHPELAVTLATNFDENDHLYFVGSISEATVKPLSERTIRSLKAEKPHLFEESMAPGSVDETGEFTLTNYHVIYKSKLPARGNLILPPAGRPELFNKVNTKTHPRAHQRLRRAPADVVYPEILAVLDYNEKYTTIYELRFLNLLMYTIAFWNTVNHRFESLENPRVRLRLTGIAVLMNRRQVKALRDAIVDNMLDADKIKGEFDNWVNNNIEGEFDIIMTQTSSVLCRRSGGAKCKNEGEVGLANIAPRCRVYRENRMTGVVHDDMKHSGEPFAAHEVAHILGANHDKDDSPEDCLYTEGYIMSTNARYNSKNYEWSRCSKERLSTNLNQMYDRCLDNPAPISGSQGELVQVEILPGSRITPEDQCLSKGYYRACEATNVCENLSCKDWWCVNVGPALEGTSCPKGECHNGKCVPKL